ncbi:MAG: hypothetical protein ABIH24_06475 [Verrucomicrobiota bacterium]
MSHLPAMLRPALQAGGRQAAKEYKITDDFLKLLQPLRLGVFA